MTGSILTMSVLFGLLFMRARHSMASTTFTNFSVAYVTAPSEEVAKKLALAVVSKKLAACVNIIPQILSIYEWDNKINEDKEILMMMKTRTSKIAELTEFVKSYYEALASCRLDIFYLSFPWSNHPYEVCEVISVPITGGNKDYFNWIEKVVPESHHPEL